MDDQLLRDFETYLDSLPRAPSTVYVYSWRLAVILRICEAQGWDPLDLTVHQVRYITAQFSPGHSTKMQTKMVLRHFWKMHGVEGPLNAIVVPPQPKSRYRGLDPEAAARLEQAAVEAGYPNGTAVLVGLYLGLRREEIVTLRWSNFDDAMEWVDITGKGNRTRHLPVAVPLRIALKPHRVGPSWVFPSNRSNRSYIHTGTVYSWVQELAARAGIGPVHPHALRHTCLATINDETGDLRTTQEFAGHADIKSTTVYTRTTRNRLLSAAAALNYRA